MFGKLPMARPPQEAKEGPIQKFFTTFGCGTPLRDHLVMVLANDESEAREAIFETFGPKFCCVYPEEDKAEKIDKYGNFPVLFILAKRRGIWRVV